MEIKEISNKIEWENFIDKQESTSMFQSWEWGEFEKSNGVGFRRMGIYKNDNLAGIFTIKYIKARRGSYIHLRHSPVIDWKDKTAREFLVDYLKKEARISRSHFIRISPLIENSEENKSVLKKLGFKLATSHAVDAELTLVIDLNKSEQELLSEMRKTTRHSIRRAENLKVETLIGGLEYFEEFYKIYQDGVKRNKWSSYSKDYIKREFEIFNKNNKAKIFLAKYNGEFIAASIFTYYKDQSVYHHSGSLSKYRNIPSTYLLQWEAIKYAKSQGYKRHNLWGISPEGDNKHPWYGLSLFKRGFGGEEVETIHAHDLVMHPLGEVTRGYEYITRKLRGYS